MSEGRQGSEGGGAPLNSGEAVERLRTAIQAKADGNGSQRELEDAARLLVTELKREERPPEEVLLLIKRILAEAGLRPSYGNSNTGSPAEGTEAAIYRDIIALSIRHYYEQRS